MYEILSELRGTNSSIEKLEILKRATDWDKELFALAYNPFIQFGVKRFKFKKTGYADLFEQSEFLFKLLTDLKERVITGNAAIEAVQDFGNSLTPISQEILTLVLKKDFKAGINIGLLNKAFGEGFIESFKIQLANKYEPNKKYGVSEWWASPKLDGLRCIWIKGKLWTRSGHEIIGFEHIEEECKMLTESLELDFIDGELYSDSVSFQDIQGIVTSNKNFDVNKKKQIYFNVFAIGHNAFRTTRDMIHLMEKIERNSKLNFIKFVEYYSVKDHEEIDSLHDDYVERGYEGIMLRHPNNWYEWKRSNSLLKYKKFIEEDFEIIDVFHGKEGTKYEECLGGILVKGEYNGVKVMSMVGSGFSDEQRQTLWINELVGKKAEIKFQNLTDKPDVDGFYSLRFPVFNKLKLDR